jgi:hypothetical protein
MEKSQTPVVEETMDLQAIVEALAPVVDDNNRTEINFGYRVDLTYKQFEAVQRVVSMLKLADLMNYKRAQDAYPRLLQSLKLVLAIADHPDQNPTEKISLATKTRAQLDSALRFAEK